MPEWLAIAAKHFEADSGYMAFTLRRYQERHALNRRQLARALHCDEAALLRLAVRPRPHPSSPTFPGEVWDLAAATGCDGFALSQLLMDEHQHDVRGYGEDAS
ncbi:MAG: hypothetical protein K6U09_04935 [Acidobacteriia bacterium]|nr:hypothetical protein [Terriglobia bacterium]